MPYPNEHAARQADPGKFKSFRRGHPSGFPKGVSVIYGIRNGKSAIQSIRFAATQWTAQRARDWLKKHGFKTGLEEATKKRVDWSGLL